VRVAHPVFVLKFSGVSGLHGVKIPIFLLSLLVIVITVLRGMRSL